MLKPDKSERPSLELLETELFYLRLEMSIEPRAAPNENHHR